MDPTIRRDPGGAPQPGSQAPPTSIVIVGGGLGGFHAAHALRRNGFAGSLSVLGAEPRPAYDRPPLSKAYLLGSLAEADLALDAPDAPVDATWVRGVLATGLTGLTGPPEPDRGRAGGTGSGTGSGPGGRVRISTRDHGEFHADAVVLATGADALRIGPCAAGSHVLRTLDDAAGLRADGIVGRDVVVVGGGFVALEVAASAVAMGAASTTVVSSAAEPLAERFGALAALALRGLHERRGVRFVTGHVTGLRLDTCGRAAGVTLEGGAEVVGTLVVSGIGVRPATGWLASGAVSLSTNGAVRCDATGRTNVPGVWALGDCAEWAGTEGTRRRTGHWQDALDQAAVVAADAVGAVAGVLPEPYCWSEQHGVTVQVAGCPTDADAVVVRAGSPETADLLLAYERDGTEVAVLGMNRQREVLRWRRTRDPRRRQTAGVGR